MIALFRAICILSFLWIIAPVFGQCPSHIKLTRQSQADSFFIYYPGCSTVTDLEIVGDSFPYNNIYGNVNNLQGLLGIKKVIGNLEIKYGRGMKNLYGLDSLTYAGRIMLLDLDSVTDMSGLESLVEVDKTLHITNNEELKSLEGLDALRYVESILLNNNYKLTTLEGLDPLSQGHPYWLTLASNTSLESLTGLQNTKELWGLNISRCPGLTNLNELENLTGLVSLRIDQNINLVDIKGLKNLEVYSVFQPSITITDNPKLVSLEGLERLTSAGEIRISNNDLLIDLKGLENLRNLAVAPRIDIIIEGNDALQSIHALDSLGAITGAIQIRDNPLLSECNIYTVCEFVQYSTNPTDIMNNAPGCNSIPEVITTCDFKYGYATGLAFLDMDCNGEFNQDDYILPNYIIESAQNNFPVSATSDQGIYRRYLYKNDTIEIQPRNLQYFTTYPDSYTVISDSTYLIIDSLDFRLCPDTLFHDLSVSMVSSIFRPGFGFGIYVCIGNLGTYIEDAVLTLDFSNLNDQYITLLSADGGGIINGTTVTWNLSDLFLYQLRCFDVRGELHPSTPLGTLLKPQAIITSTSGVTEDLSNNEVVLEVSVVGSYDPNDKTVNPDRILYSDQSQTLDYTIRFQNTGTFPAAFIEIVDTLENELDMRSFKMIASSHPYTLSFPDTNIIKWRFDNINLPDSALNEAASHGFVHFSLSTRRSLIPGTVVTNKAAIYFDFNAPVITNAASTLVDLESKTFEPTGSPENVSIYPNPTSGVFNMKFEKDEGINLIEVFDTNGHLLQSFEISHLHDPHQVEMDMHEFPAGIYYLRLLIEKGVITKKIVLFD